MSYLWEILRKPYNVKQPAIETLDKYCDIKLPPHPTIPSNSYSLCNMKEEVIIIEFVIWIFSEL